VTDSPAVFTFAYGLLVGTSAVSIVWALVEIARRLQEKGKGDR